MITAKGKQFDWHADLTVQEVLERLGYALPMVLVRVNGQVVRRQDWPSIRLQDGAVVDVQPIVAGG
jgi:sulfur carrier protein